MAVKSFWTSSTFKAWWFTQFHEYEIKGRKRVNRERLYGKMYYDQVWLLCPPNREQKSRVFRGRR